MAQVTVGKQVISTATAPFALWGIADEVASIAEAEGYHRGAYYVIFSTPIDNFSHIKKSLRDNLLAYIKETQFLENAPELTVFEQGLQKCSIQKLHDQKNYVGKVGPSGAKWEGEIASEICALLEERISTKQEKLREIYYPKILLFYDASHFSDYQMYQACLDRIPSLVSFRTLFLVPNDGQGILLYSECEEWLSP